MVLDGASRWATRRIDAGTSRSPGRQIDDKNPKRSAYLFPVGRPGVVRAVRLGR